MTSTLREGRAELHGRLNAAAYEGRYSRQEAGITGAAHWTRQELCELLAEARDAVIRCPHQTCAYCYQVERKEAL